MNKSLLNTKQNKSKRKIKKRSRFLWFIFGIVLGALFGRTLGDSFLLVCGYSISGGVMAMLSNIFCETVCDFRKIQLL